MDATKNATDTCKVALERFFKDLSYGHEFFIDQAFVLAAIWFFSLPLLRTDKKAMDRQRMHRTVDDGFI